MDMITLFDSNQGDLVVRHKKGTFKVISWLVLAKCPSLALQIQKIQEEKKEFDLSSFTMEIVRHVFRYIYFYEEFVFESFSVSEWYQLLSLAKMFDLTKKILLPSGAFSEIKYVDHISKIIDSKSKHGNPFDIVLIAHEHKDEVRMNAAIEKIVVGLRKKIGKTCYDTLLPGEGVRPAKHEFFVCCQHSFPAPKEHHLRTTHHILAIDHQEICYNATKLGRIIPANFNTSLCCKHGTALFDSARFKKLPKDLQKEILKRIVPKELITDSDENIMQIVI